MTKPTLQLTISVREFEGIESGKMTTFKHQQFWGLRPKDFLTVVPVRGCGEIRLRIHYKDKEVWIEFQPARRQA